MGETSRVFIIIRVERQLQSGKIYIQAIPEHPEAIENIPARALAPPIPQDDQRVLEGMMAAMQKTMPWLKELNMPTLEIVGWLLKEEDYEKLGRPTIDSRIEITLKLLEPLIIPKKKGESKIETSQIPKHSEELPKIPKGDDFKCNGCGEIILESDFPYQEKHLYLALKEKRLCETCLRKEGSRIE